MKLPEKYRKWVTIKAWINCFRVAVALLVIAWLYEFAHIVIFSEATSVWFKTLYLVVMAFFFSLILWLLGLISPEFMDTIFRMLGFKEKEDKKDED